MSTATARRSAASGPQGILTEQRLGCGATSVLAAIIVVFVLPAALLYLVWRRRGARTSWIRTKVDPLSGPIVRRASRGRTRYRRSYAGDKAKADMDVVHVVPALSPARSVPRPA